MNANTIQVITIRLSSSPMRVRNGFDKVRNPAPAHRLKASQVPRPTLGSRSGERTPWERLFFLPGPLAPKMLLLPPHTTYIIGFLCTWLGPGHRRNFWNSILAGATADLDAHPVCPLARTTHIYSISLSFLHGFATRGHFVFLTVRNHCSKGNTAALKHTFHHWFTK